MEERQPYYMRGFGKIMDTRMYVLTKEACKVPEDGMYQALQLGSSKNPIAGMTGDHTGDHISEKNPQFAELTGLYWLWKNVDCDILGICSIDRLFSKKGKLLSKADIENDLENYDVLLAPDSHVSSGTIREQLLKLFSKEDLELFYSVLKEKEPEYEAACHWVLEGQEESVFPMLIMKKDQYDAYCDWLFGLLFELEKRMESSSQKDSQGSRFCVLAGHLLRAWLLCQEVFVYEESMMIRAKKQG